jgi:Fe-S-cluster containining protein
MEQAKGMEQFIAGGYCEACRGCCRFSRSQGPWLPHLLESEAGLRERVRVVEAQGESHPFVCKSLDSARNSCAIYASRPFECRLYPFVLNRRDSRFFLSVDPNCPYIKEREADPEFAAYSSRLAGWLQAPRMRAELAKNLHLFEQYPDVRDIVELKI